MDSSPVGRRRLRHGGSPRNDPLCEATVTVGDLIKRQPAPVREKLTKHRSSSHAARVHTAPPRTPASDPVGLPTGDYPTLSRTARVMIGVIGGLLLCTSATATSLISTQETRAFPGPGARAAGPITGVAALRPDLLREAQWPFPDNGGYASQRQGAPQPSDANPGDQTFTQPEPTPSPAGLTTARPDAGSTEAALNVVRDFYHLLGTNPSSALTRVSPSLLGTQGTELASSWKDITSVQPLRVLALRDGEVLGEVVARHADGSELDLEQKFTVERGPHPLIVNVELVSASHNP